MARNPLQRFLMSVHPGDGVDDADLLRRFVADRDEAAFELLVRRHADMVWKACRQVARTDPDAEDAFQAAFLALARKAGAIRGAVGGWLYRVAVNAALKARARTARFPAADLIALRDASARPAGSPDAELAGVIHEEIARLAERYRQPVVLCDLDGLTHADAARQLGWPVGTVSGRLSRARVLLRGRLERRGVTLPVAGAVIFGSEGIALGPDLIRAAVGIGAGGRVPAAAVATLTEGVLITMRTAKLLVAAAVAAVGIGVAGTAWVLAQDKGQGGPPMTGTVKPAAADPKPAEPAAGYTDKDMVATEFPDIPRLPKPDWKIGELMPKVLPTDDAATRLRKRKLLAAFQQFSLYYEVFVAGAVGQAEWEGFYPNLLSLCKEMTTAASQLWEKPDDLRPWFEWRVAAAKDIEKITHEIAQKGLVRPHSEYAAHRERLDAELALLALLAKAPNR